MTWENVTTALTNLTGVVSTVFTAATDNPIIMACLVVPVFSAAVYVVKRLFKLAK
jgi:hypothetical protein